MILELLFEFVLGLFNVLIELIPHIDLDSNFILGFASVASVMDGASYLISFPVFFGCLSIFFLLHNVTLIISIINWVIRKIPTID